MFAFAGVEVIVLKLSSSASGDVMATDLSIEREVPRKVLKKRQWVCWGKLGTTAPNESQPEHVSFQVALIQARSASECILAVLGFTRWRFGLILQTLRDFKFASLLRANCKPHHISATPKRVSAGQPVAG